MMPRLLSLVLALTAAAACQPEPGDRSAPASAAPAVLPAPLPTPSAAPATLDGLWRVTAIDGRAAGGVELWGTGGQLRWMPDCAGQARSFVIEGGTFRTLPPRALGEVCDIGYPPELTETWMRLDTADRITADGANRVTIGTAERGVTLTRVPGPATLTGEWRVAAIDGGQLDETYGIALSANAREIWWEPRCAGVARGYAIDGAAIRIGPAPSAGPPLPSGAPPRPVCTIGLPPRLSDAMGALGAATAIRNTPSGGVELHGGGRSLVLFRQ